MIGDNPKISVSNRGEWESVDVFMIAMDDTDIDDLEKELQDLQRVMVDQLHWRVQRHQLRSDTQRSLDLSIAALLEVIVGTCNGRKNALCWVLCSGHGGNRDGSLSWTGRSDSEPWVNVTHFQQQLLSKLDCSVIIQTDLCYAGLAANHAQLQQDLLRPYPKETPSQELLLSCGVPETSTMGTRSFSQDTTQALRGLLDQEAPLTLQDIVRVSHRKNVRYTASCVRLRLNGPRVIELYQCYQNLHQQVRSKLLRWVAKLIPETRCFVAVLGPRVNRRWNTEDIVRYECNLVSHAFHLLRFTAKSGQARTVDDVMGWYKAKIKAPDE